MAVPKFETKVLIIYQFDINKNNNKKNVMLSVNNNKMRWDEDEDDMNDVYTIINSP